MSPQESVDHTAQHPCIAGQRDPSTFGLWIGDLPLWARPAKLGVYGVDRGECGNGLIRQELAASMPVEQTQVTCSACTVDFSLACQADPSYVVFQSLTHYMRLHRQFPAM